MTVHKKKICLAGMPERHVTFVYPIDVGSEINVVVIGGIDHVTRSFDLRDFDLRKGGYITAEMIVHSISAAHFNAT